MYHNHTLNLALLREHVRPLDVPPLVLNADDPMNPASPIFAAKLLFDCDLAAGGPDGDIPYQTFAAAVEMCSLAWWHHRVQCSTITVVGWADTEDTLHEPIFELPWGTVMTLPNGYSLRSLFGSTLYWFQVNDEGYVGGPLFTIEPTE